MGSAGRNVWRRSASLGLRVVMVAMAVVCAAAPVSYALPDVRVAPNPNDMIRQSNGAPDNTISLVLKDTPSSAIRTISMAAYMQTPVAGTLFSITDRDVTNRCAVFGTENRHIEVTFTVQTTLGPNSVRYDVPYNQICSGGPAANTIANRGNARFFGSYELPPALFGPTAQIDPGSGAYRLGITIAYGAGVPQGPGGQQLITFKARLGAAGYLSMVPLTTASDRNYSTIGQDINQHSTVQHFKFGLPCNISSPQEETVNVYDVDNGQNGGLIATFSIERRVGASWVKESFSLGSQVTGESAQPLSTPTDIRPLNGSGQVTSVTFDLQPFTNYRLRLNNIDSGNLIGIGLPTETLYGDLDCSADLDGAIAVSPSANPINDGEQITLTPQTIRNGTVDFPSVFNYTWRTWFDTGDEVYQSGEDRPCPEVTRNNVTHALSGTQSLLINGSDACTTTASSARSNGAAAKVCGQLILTRVDSFTDIGVGEEPDGLTRCVPIGKFPHLEVRSGDVFAGGQFRTFDSMCTVVRKPVVASSRRQIPDGSGPFYTSYSMYGVTSLGMSRTFGSMGISYDTAAATLADDLVFANTPGEDGYFYSRDSDANNFPPAGGLRHCLNDPFEHFGTRPTTAVPGTTIDISTLPGDTLLTSSATITLTASQPIPAGKKIVIYANSSPQAADIHIRSNITYADGPHASLNLLPQVVIMTNGHITIHGNVTQLDGVYVAKRNIYTCNLIPKLHLCGNHLTINGAVIAGENVVPVRTGGADSANLSAMAETFNLRPDVLLGQVPDQGSSNTFLKTMSETEVPARF